MKKKNILAYLLAATILNGTAFAEISVDGVIDRAFTEDRTLYFVEISGDEIPDISAEGYELIKKAEKPYIEGALLKENSTIIKNTETGVKYRFVFEKKEGKVEIDRLNLSTAGILTVNGKISGLEKVNLLILKPTDEFSESAFKISDVTDDAMEKTVLDAIEITKDSIDGEQIIKYTFPQTALSGQYGFLITGTGVAEKYYSEVYYMSETAIENVISDVNEKSNFDDINTVELLKEYIENNSKKLYIDLTNYNKLSDEAKKIVISGLESEKDYETLDEIGNAFNKAVTVAWLYDGLTPEEILEDNESFELEMYENYLELDNKREPGEAVRGIKDEEEIRAVFNKTVALVMVNEAEPADIKEILEKYNIYLGINEELYGYFIVNSSKCIKALGNKEFKDVSDIEDAIKAVKNGTNSSGGGKGSGSGGGISAQIPAGGVNYVAPITQQRVETEEKPKQETAGNNSLLPFTDIENVSWAYTAIEHLYNNKILNGKSESLFAPDDNVKREEFVKLVVNGFGLEKEGNIKFEDVEKDSWYENFLNIAFNSGIVTGLSETEFGVGKYITREDIAVMIYRAVKASGMNVEIIVENPAEISDLDAVSDYAKEAVEFMIAKGAVNGINGEFKPKAYATRAQTAQMLYQIIKIR